MSLRWKTKEFYGGLTKNLELGWFEHNHYGDEYGGNLVFQKMGNTYVLEDYDGISDYLPKEICDLFESFGDELFDMSYGRDPDGNSKD